MIRRLESDDGYSNDDQSAEHFGLTKDGDRSWSRGCLLVDLMKFKACGHCKRTGLRKGRQVNPTQVSWRVTNLPF
jgi:hypothetical protein